TPAGHPALRARDRDRPLARLVPGVRPGGAGGCVTRSDLGPDLPELRFRKRPATTGECRLESVGLFLAPSDPEHRGTAGNAAVLRGHTLDGAVAGTEVGAARRRHRTDMVFGVPVSRVCPVRGPSLRISHRCAFQRSI